MGWEALGAARDLPRLHEITSVFIRYGLSDLVRKAGVGTVVERAGQVLHWGEASDVARLELHERLRLALERLGPTFVKLGQLLSTREDLLPPDWIAELSKLQSRVAPVPFEELLPQLQESLGKSPFEVFLDLEREPYASASIAQVHQAKLANGTPVILKIRRPGIRAKIEADLRILAQIAQLIESEMPEATRYQPTQVVMQFARSLERELDLAVEARHIERFARNFAGEPNVLVPRVYGEWTSNTMNVQEHINGIRGDDMAGIEAAGLDRRLLAARGADAILKMILVDGFFHADPHPGNVLYLPGNRLALIDFGMVGRLTPSRRNQIVELLAGVAAHDDEAMLDVMLEWTGETLVDEAALAADLGELAFDFADVQLKDFRVGTLLQRLATILREHSIVMPADLTMMFKALISLEGLGRKYDPEFKLIERLKPFLDQAVAERYQPVSLFRRGRANVDQFLHMVGSVPRDLARLLRDARRGRTRIELDLKRLDSFGRKLDAAIDRITIGLMTASLVIGSSIVMTVQGGPTVLGAPVLTMLGLFGYVGAFINSVWIIFSVWRAHRGG